MTEAEKAYKRLERQYYKWLDSTNLELYPEEIEQDKRWQRLFQELQKKIDAEKDQFEG